VLGQINGAKRISPDSPEERIRDVVPDLTTPIIVYCATGDRCASVADRLQRMRYRGIFTLKGSLRGLVGSRRSSRFSTVQSVSA
jgi:rhodanese-related sulfurtransferase